MLSGLPLVLGSCLEHRAAPNCEFKAPPHSKEPGEDCTEDEQCVLGSVCFEGTCVGDGTLRVSLGWHVSSDFDLHVVTPEGAELYYADDNHSGGQLDVDDCVISCREPDDTHVENIFFGTSAQLGTYQVWVENFNGRRSGAFFIEVEGDGIYEFWEGSLAASPGAISQIFSFVFDPPPDMTSTDTSDTSGG